MGCTLLGHEKGHEIFLEVSFPPCSAAKCFILFFKSIIPFFKEKLLFSGVKTLFYTFFLPKIVNLVIEDSSDFTFRDLMSLRG